MKKKATLYDAHEKKILQQSSVFAKFLAMKGVIEDPEIDNEAVRKAKQSAAKKAYHNTEVLLELYRTIIWVLECVPGELADELHVQTKEIDALLDRLDFEVARENKRIESKLNTVIKTRVMLERLQEALMVLRKKPNDGEQLYGIIYDAYLNPVKRTASDLFERAGVASRTYYRMRSEAITIMSIKLWSAPAGDVDDWLEILTMMQEIK